MRKGHLSQYFSGVAIKRLASVEVDKNVSHQHEIQGVQGLKELLGTERLQDYPASFSWMGGEGETVSEAASVTWYDSREYQESRSPEFRLYYKHNDPMELASTGDLLVVARRPSDEIFVFLAPVGSTVEEQLSWLFGYSDQMELGFLVRNIDDDDRAVDYAARFVLEEIGIEFEDPDADKFEALIDRFGDEFPNTADFSKFARSTLPEVSAADDPDTALVAWLDREERLFLQLEKRDLQKKLERLYDPSGDVDVSEFMSLAKAAQNRRKSRAGLALEHHVGEALRQSRIKFEPQGRTEVRRRPDFLFPSSAAYHDPNYPDAGLAMLGAKSTCKDRWRQVLAEADRILNKHLLTLEPGISEAQTSEMMSRSLQLVLPRSIHPTFSDAQQGWLWSLQDFIEYVRKSERKHLS